jgi:hypothetical protein
MKKAILIVFILLGVSDTILSQSIIGDVSFCHTTDKKLFSCSEGNYTLQFEKQQLKSFFTKDSSIVFDVDKKYFQLKKNDKVAIILELQNSTQSVILQDKRNDSTYPIKFINESISCQTQPYNFTNIYYDSTMITLNYSYCRLVSIGIVDIQMGSFNFSIFQCIGKPYYSWEAIFTQMEKMAIGVKGVKMLSNRIDGKPDFISIFNEKKPETNLDQSMPGVEILSLPKKSNCFYRVRLVTNTKNSKLFDYEDIIIYDKKGKLKSAKVDIKQCD